MVKTFPFGYFGGKFWTTYLYVPFTESTCIQRKFSGRSSQELSLSWHLHSNRNFWNFWVNGKQPWSNSFSLLSNNYFLFTLAAVTKCYNCIEAGGSWSDCQRSQTRKKCNALLGNTHCYSASGKYDNGTAILDVVARGCIDCSGEKNDLFVNLFENIA